MVAEKPKRGCPLESVVCVQAGAGRRGRRGPRKERLAKAPSTSRNAWESEEGASGSSCLVVCVVQCCRHSQAMASGYTPAGAMLAEKGASPTGACIVVASFFGEG